MILFRINVFVIFISIFQYPYAAPEIACDIDERFSTFHTIVRSGEGLPKAFYLIDTKWLGSKIKEIGATADETNLQVSSMQIYALMQTFLVDRILSFEKTCSSTSARLEVNIKHAYDEYSKINVSFVRSKDEWLIRSTSYD